MPETAIDFESFYDSEYSISKMGYYAYTHDPRFRVTAVAFADPATLGTASAYIDEKQANAPWEERLSGRVAIAHNATFDRHVFERLQELGNIPPGIKPAEWLCTAAMCRYLQVPGSLAEAAEAVLGITVDKSTRTKAKGDTRKQGDLFDALSSYAQKDADTCARLWAAGGKFWPENERQLWRLTEAIGDRGVYIDQAALADLTTKTEERVAKCRGLLPWADKLPPTSIKALAAACKAAGIEVPPNTKDGDPDLDAWFGKEEVADSPAEWWVRTMQDFRRANRRLKLCDAIRSRIKPDGRMEAHLMYCGAINTGRWSGGGHGLNLQNLNTDTEEGDLRGVIAAPPGRKFIILDFSQIEARILLWLAGEMETLGLVRNGCNLYEAHARATMGWAGGELKRADSQLYKLAKARVLGLGFGCSSKKFASVAKIMAGLDLTEAECEQTVSQYRGSNRKIVDLWYSTEKEMVACHGGTYSMPLPSGRRLRYRNVNAKNMTAEQVKGEPSNVYGALLAENCLAGDNEVLIKGKGWTRLDHLAQADLVWDGLAFVSHNGLVNKGEAEVTDFGGVLCTEDHLFLDSNNCWKPAKKACVVDCMVPLYRYEQYNQHTSHMATQRLSWQTVWTPSGDQKNWQQRDAHPLGSDLRLRGRQNAKEFRPHSEKENQRVLLTPMPASLSAHTKPAKDSWKEPSQAVCNLEEHDRSLPSFNSPSLQELRGTGDTGLSRVAGFFHGFLERHGEDLETRPLSGSPRQRRQLQPRELPLGFVQRECSEHPRCKDSWVGFGQGRRPWDISEYLGLSDRRGNARSSLVRRPELRCKVPPERRRETLVDRPVFDILNCGPRNSFAVRPPGAAFYFIAHNCTQATARDLFAEAVLNLDDAGLRPVMLIHDEVVIEVDEQDAEAALQDATKIMTTPPAWAEGLPVDVEGRIAERYGK